MKLFLDTNIFIEYFAKRSQFTFVKQIFDAIEDGEYEGVLSAGSFYTIAYAMEMELKRQGIHNPEKLELNRKYLNRILDLTHIISGSDIAYRQAVNDESFRDIEDSFQYQCASEYGCDILLTINLRDFRHADNIRVMCPDEFVKEFYKD